jgi:hypothetical protein
VTDTPCDGHSCFETLLVEGMNRRLTCLIEEQLVDKEIRNWLIPDFSTTTDQDVAVASMTMMGAMKKYFTYEANTGCGFPSVTLLGDIEDWENMRKRLELLLSGTYGSDLTTWAGLLVPIFDRFILTFSTPDSQDLKDFWMQVAHASRRMSGQTKRFSG